ncbi:MAG: signal peptidase II [Gemmatimonadales bacterium]|nr:MAG: signal peptidase II [Gemmatimonadales bacterium]
MRWTWSSSRSGGHRPPVIEALIRGWSNPFRLARPLGRHNVPPANDRGLPGMDEVPGAGPRGSATPFFRRWPPKSFPRTLSGRMSIRTGSRAAVAAAILSTIGCDRVTKHAAVTHLADAPWRSYLGDMVRIGYAENTGGLLGIGSGLPPGVRTAIFAVGTGLLLAGLAVLALRGRWVGLSLLGAAFLFAGGISNWVDRVTRGAVVDFVNVGIGPLRTGIFNVADVAIFMGIGLFLVGGRDRGGARG